MRRLTKLRRKVPQVTPRELKAELDGPNPPVLVDVREADELSISRLPGIIHIPMDELPDRMGELDPDADIVMVCRTGNRSASTTRFLLESGFSRVRNLAKGMNGWSADVDPSVRTY